VHNKVPKAVAGNIGHYQTLKAETKKCS